MNQRNPSVSTAEFFNKIRQKLSFSGHEVEHYFPSATYTRTIAGTPYDFLSASRHFAVDTSHAVKKRFRVVRSGPATTRAD
jgi:hypothetical protein